MSLCPLVSASIGNLTRYTVSDVYGDGFRLETIFFVGDGEANNTGLRIEGFRVVEDEVADAVYQWDGSFDISSKIL